MVIVMEPLQSNYRLERWLAFFLSLLFFLPFVAKADDIVFASDAVYHADEMPYQDGEEFLALARNHVLVPMTIIVKPARDMFDKDGEATGKQVTLPDGPKAYLLRGQNLHAGPIVPAKPEFAELLPNVWNATFTLGETPYDVSYRCNDTECTMVLEQGQRSQDLVTIPIEREGKKIITLDVEQHISFAGDLDHDGRLDLIANLARHWNEWRPVLLLSTAAKDGQLVGVAAELTTTGC